VAGRVVGRGDQNRLETATRPKALILNSTIATPLLGGRLQNLMTTSAHEIKSVLYGLAIIGFLRFDPRGLRGIWHDLRHTWVQWPLRY
jgi:hypothetical protein